MTAEHIIRKNISPYDKKSRKPSIEEANISGIVLGTKK
jgi:hypothetical protein